MSMHELLQAAARGAKNGFRLWWLVVFSFAIMAAAFWYVGSYAEAKIAVRAFIIASVGLVAWWIGFINGKQRGVADAIAPFFADGVERERLDELHVLLVFDPAEYANRIMEMINVKPEPLKSPSLSGKTANRLIEAIRNFPEQYPQFTERPPKLDDDVRPWLKSVYGASDREAHVFGAIISEHFGF